MSIPDEKLARWTALPRQFSSPERSWHHGVNDRAYFDHEPYLTVCADDARESIVAFLPHTSDLDALAIAALPEMREALDELVAEVRELQHELETSGEAIMLVRQHLAEVGIEATFFDDVGALAAQEIKRLRGAP